jgi:hypothetical protein
VSAELQSSPDSVPAELSRNTTSTASQVSSAGHISDCEVEVLDDRDAPVIVKVVVAADIVIVRVGSASEEDTASAVDVVLEEV